jgi:hypothetical protein
LASKRSHPNVDRLHQAGPEANWRERIMSQIESERTLRAEIENGFSAKLAKVPVTLRRNDNPDIFSGTLFRHGERLFVITCEHPLPNHPNRVIQVIRDTPTDINEVAYGVIDHFKHPGGRPDVALLELDPTILDGYLKGYRPIGLEDFGEIDYSIDTHRTPVVVGNAGENVDYHKRDGIVRGIEVGIHYFCHDLVNPADWPAPLKDDKSDDPATGMYMKSVRRDCTEEEARRFYYRNPKGLSGGGIWVHRARAGEIWSPSEIKLVGVQSSWDWKRGYLHGTTIDSVKRLIPNL